MLRHQSRPILLDWHPQKENKKIKKMCHYFQQTRALKRTESCQWRWGCRVEGGKGDVKKKKRKYLAGFTEAITKFSLLWNARQWRVWSHETSQCVFTAALWQLQPRFQLFSYNFPHLLFTLYQFYCWKGTWDAQISSVPSCSHARQV